METRTGESSAINHSKDYRIEFKNKESDEISFIGTQTCCVCFVDMVNSTRITSNLENPEKVRKYYSIFLNSMAAIARSAGAKIIKNIGDSIVFYFPDTSDLSGIPVFHNGLECCSTMIGARDTINRRLHEEGLPAVSYRISADYGRVEVAKSATSVENDMFGSIMDRCCRINLKALPNGIAVGDGLYRAVKSTSMHHITAMGYHFEEIIPPQDEQAEFSSYPLYHLQRNNSVSTLSRPEIDEDRFAPANILLVDDEEDCLSTFKRCLSLEGYNTDAFTDPTLALAHVAKLNPSHYKLVILDIRMPGLNGLQLYYRLKAINRNIKILFISALDAVPELTSILPDTKATDSFIKKPITIDNFVGAVKAVL